MSPRAERIETEVPTEEQRGFFIRLDTPEDFDPLKFDQLVQELLGYRPEVFPENLKYIVRGERMLVFPVFLRHSDADKRFRRIGFDEELRSAGFIEVNPLDESTVRRCIYGDSSSLSLNGQLPIRESNKYKLSVLREKLSLHFDVE